MDNQKSQNLYSILNDYDKELLRYCAKHLLEKGPHIEYEKCPRHEGMNLNDVNTVVYKLQQLGLMKQIFSGHFEVFSTVIDLVYQWDHPPLPDYRARIIKWFWSKPWSLPVWIIFWGIPALFGWIVMLIGILKWFGIPS